MKRKILIGLLSAGTILGFASGFASMKCKAKERRAAFEQRVAETCVRAARAEQQRSPEGR